MKNLLFCFAILLCLVACKETATEDAFAENPIIFADVPDMSMIRVGDTYYMASTTMHMSPGLPIMKSKDLVNWQLVSYAYETLADNELLRLENGKNAYGAGSWAPCLRYHEGVYYASTFASTSGKTHIYKTTDIESGKWEEISFSPSIHDHTIFFDDDGKVYIIHGVGRITLMELKDDLTGIKEGSEMLLIENASAPAGDNIMLPAEGSQLFKRDGKYYLFNITWLRGGMRKVVIHRADNIKGPYEGKLALRDRGIAQGGLIDTPEGDWYAYLFRDYGSVGRIPYLVPVKWEDGWPILGIDGKVPDTLNLPANRGLAPGIVASDDFNRSEGDSDLPLVWQWNHNPDNNYWSLNERKGFLRLTTGRIDNDVLSARNMLTQRTFGPESSAIIKIDVSNMENGDCAGLIALQRKYGYVGVKMEDAYKFITMVSVNSNEAVETDKIALEQNDIWFRIDCDFKDLKDEAYFYYSLNGEDWNSIGGTLKMAYTLPHFMGYRFGLFNFATQNIGGYVDFDFYHINDKIGNL